MPATLQEQCVREDGTTTLQMYANKTQAKSDNSPPHIYTLQCLQTGGLFSALALPKPVDSVHSAVQLQQTLEHGHVLRLQRVFDDARNVYMLYEHCGEMTLAELVARRGRLTEFEARYYTYQLSSAVQYLHDSRVMHRALQPEAIFINAGMEVKLGGCGLCERLDDSKGTFNAFCGVPAFMAPEMLSRKQGYSFAADMWALGVCIHNMVTGVLPFDGATSAEVLKKVEKGKFTFPKDVALSPEVKDLISKLLERDVSKRLTIRQLMAHPFMNNGVNVARVMCPSTIDVAPSKALMDELLSRGYGIELDVADARPDQTSTPADLHVSRSAKAPGNQVVGYLLSCHALCVVFPDASRVILSTEGKPLLLFMRTLNGSRTCRAYHATSIPSRLSPQVCTLLQISALLSGTVLADVRFCEDAAEVPVDVVDNAYYLADLAQTAPESYTMRLPAMAEQTLQVSKYSVKRCGDASVTVARLASDIVLKACTLRLG